MRRLRRLRRRPLRPRRSLPSRAAPPAQLSLEEKVRLVRTPAPGGVVGERYSFLTPRLKERVDDSPRLSHLVGAYEQRRVADHRVMEETLVGIRVRPPE